MELDKFVRVYTESEKWMSEEVTKEPDKRNILLHTLAISALFSLPVILFLVFSFYLSAFFVFQGILLFLVTAISIVIIEYITFLVAKWQNGKGDYWKQLNITNTYLTPIFIIFFILFAMHFITGPFLPFRHFEIGIIFLPILWYLNDKKIKIVHGINNALLPNIVYIVGIGLAEIFWIAIILQPFVLVPLFV